MNAGILNLIIVGAGGHGRSVAEAATASGAYQVVAFIDDIAPQISHVCGIPIVGALCDLERFITKANCAIVAVGNNELRRDLSERVIKAGGRLASVLHPAAVISPTAMISNGCAVMAGAIVGASAQIGNSAILNCGAIVDHDAKVGNYAHLGVNAAIAGGSSIGELGWLKPGAVLGYDVHLPDRAVGSSAAVDFLPIKPLSRKENM